MSMETPAGAVGDVGAMPARHGIGRWVRAGLVTLAAVMVVVLLAGLLWLRTIEAGLFPGAALVSTSAWQTYHDPLNLFSIKAPTDWSVLHEEGSGTFGDRSGSYSYTGEDIWLGVPPENVDGLGVWLNVEPLTTDFARQWTCQAFNPSFGTIFAPSTTLGGIPASYDGGDTWMVEAHDAHFQINAHYPGGPQSPHGSPAMPLAQPTPTPVPPGQLATGKQIISTVLASFMLTNPTPLSC